MAAEIVYATDPHAILVTNRPVIQPLGNFPVAPNIDATVAGYVAIAVAQKSDLRDQIQSQHPITPAILDSSTSESMVADPRIGTLVGNYLLKSVIASGGMGTVYHALQCHPVHRTVALKMIRCGMADASTLGRFHSERQALALMDHPDIAQVFEADATADGNPYFAMEYCTGEPIDQYCKNNQLDLKSTLNLVIRIARAVQQAHARGVIHRDLKPSNVLVSPCEGGLSLKIIDFGIAKFTDDQWIAGDREATRIGELIGTPAYMSPEQALGIEVDARTDVFAVGAILFKLLTDTTPLCPKNQDDEVGSSLSAIVEQLKSFTPTTPSSRFAALPYATQRELAGRLGFESTKNIKQAIRGDLDWITLRAIESDRTRRYATANDFADDLQRFLQNEPVTAHAPSRLYLAKKFYDRNRVAVLAAIAITFVTLISSVIGGIGWWNYEQERAEEVKRIAEETEILLGDVASARLLATKGGADAEVNFATAEASLAKAESILSGPHDLQFLASLVDESRRAISDDRTALRLIQRLECARERASSPHLIKDRATFGPEAALAEITSAFDSFGTQVANTLPTEAAKKLLNCPQPFHKNIIQTLDFLIIQHSINSNADETIAQWASDVAELIDPDRTRRKLREYILTADLQSLQMLACHPAEVCQPDYSLLVLAESLYGLFRSSESIDKLRLLQSRHPDDFWTNHHLGVALSQSGTPTSLEQSIRYLTVAVALRPKSIGARVNLSDVLMRSGDQIAAADHLRAASELIPENHAIVQKLKSLKSTNNEPLPQ